MTFEEHKNKLKEAAELWHEAVRRAKDAGYQVKTELCVNNAYIYSFEISAKLVNK